MASNTENDPPLTRYRGIVESTGEVIDIDAPAVRGRRRRGKRRPFALVDLASLDRLELSALEWRVLHRIMRAVNPETNEANIYQAEIAEDLGVPHPSVSRAYRTLCDRRVVFRLRRGVHRVNTNIMFRGSTQDWNTISTTEKEPLWRR